MMMLLYFLIILACPLNQRVPLNFLKNKQKQQQQFSLVISIYRKGDPAAPDYVRRVFHFLFEQNNKTKKKLKSLSRISRTHSTTTDDDDGPMCRMRGLRALFLLRLSARTHEAGSWEFTHCCWGTTIYISITVR